MKDDARSWALAEESITLRFQPVFTAQGQVHEYAVIGRSRPSPWSGLNPVGQGAGLLAGVAFFKHFKTPIELSYEHALDVRGTGDLAERLCGELGIGLLDSSVWVNKHARYDDAPPLLIPAKRITFTLPLTDRLSDHAEVLARYSEFQARLRARLLPSASRSKSTGHGTLRADGLHVQVPLGLSENRALQGRFFTLMERAWSANLHVVAGGVEDIRDFAWMRLHSDLLFRGAALSAPLSSECLGIWLQADSNAWRSFNASTTRFAGVEDT